MHILLSENRSELLASPQLVKLELSQRGHVMEPTLLIKAGTLLLKYNLASSTLRRDSTDEDV